MRKKFSEKYNFKKTKDVFQLYSVDEALRNRIWNQVQIYYFDQLEIEVVPFLEKYTEKVLKNEKDYNFFKNLYDIFFKLINNKIEKNRKSLTEDIYKKFLNLEWYEIYDFIEFISQTYHKQELNNDFRNKINQVLEDEMSGYRFIDKLIAPIIDDIEIQSIENALHSDYIGAKQHISKSLELISNRKNPDYINSIKESISAVESVTNSISGKTNVALNRCMNHLPFEIDKNLKNGMINIYSWTSAADGIRHGVTGNEIKSSFAEAKYMLATCSAFINYLIDKQKQT